MNKLEDKPRKKEPLIIYPHNEDCNEVDESFRIDDNPDFSTAAIVENSCLDAPDVPGLGLESEEEWPQ